MIRVFRNNRLEDVSERENFRHAMSGHSGLYSGGFECMCETMKKSGVAPHQVWRLSRKIS